MSKQVFNYKLLAVALGGLYLSGCGSDSDIASCGPGEAQSPDGRSCVTANTPPPPPAPPAPAPLQCVEPQVLNDAGDMCIDPGLPAPVVMAAENQAVLYYNRPDGDYEGYVVHLFNDPNDTGLVCDSIADEALTVWPNGPSIDGVDPNYGGYWVIPLKEGFGDCMSFIVHLDGAKDLSESDRVLDLTGDRMGWTLSGVPDVFLEAVLGAEGAPLEGAALHWVSENEFVWDLDTSSVSTVRLYHSLAADMTFVPGVGVGEGQSFVELTPGATLSDASLIPAPQQGWEVLSADIDAEQAKALLKSQLIAVAYDANNDIVAATRVQHAKAIDAVYTTGENDADEATLGLVYGDADINAHVWAPTAQSLELNVYDATKELVETIVMTENTDSGVWSAEVDASYDRMFFRYDVTVYHPVTGQLETIWSTDPYSVSLSTDGRYSQFVNLDDEDLKPEGWDSHDIPVVANFEDAVIYEGHVRDFSARDESTSEANRGKYLAFTEKDSVPMQHLQRLSDAGMNHFHLLPVNDIASIGEDPVTRVNIMDTVGDLCAANENAPVCGVEDEAATILSVLESYDPASTDAQTLVNSMRGLDSFNWGYDPHHFNAPEGSYSSDPEGTARILEMRAMNQSLHEIGMRVVMDNVYNHTNASGLNLNSVLDKVVPGYYHRYNLTNGNIERSTCCENTATENVMMAKLMTDSLVMWTEQYKFDGFRFDLMGHIPRDAVLASREAVLAVDPDNYFYGEGWDFGEVAGDRLFVQARQDNMADTEVGTFNDRIREAVRGGAFFSGNTDGGVLNVMDTIKVGMAGTLEDYVFVDRNDNQSTGGSQGGYAGDPADIINYISVHDNETLWDQFNYTLPADLSLSDRVRIQNVALSIPMLSQGIPFFHMGSELLRSKSMDRNTFDAGDWFNLIDFTGQTNNFNVGLPLEGDNGARWDEMRAFIGNAERSPGATDIDFAAAVFEEFLSIRTASPLFKLTTAQDIAARVGFHTVGREQVGGLIVASIDDGTGLTDLDPSVDAIVIVVNGSASEQAHTVSTAAGFELHATLAGSVDSVVQGASFAAGDGEGTFTVPAYTTAVFVKPQGAEQGAGLSAFVTTGQPDVAPYADTVFLRGSMNDWADPPTEPFTYAGDNIYSVGVSLTAGTEYLFKVASADWAAVNFGGAAGDETVMLGESKTLESPGSDLSFTPDTDGVYVFSVDATDTAAPVLTVSTEEPYQGTTIFLRGTMNDWADPPTQPFTYDGQGIYFTEVNLTAGEYMFKVASGDWDAVNLGSAESIGVGEELALVPGSGDNVALTIETDGDYVFTVDATDTAAPVVSVFESGMYGDAEIFVRGNFNSWGEAEGVMPMTFDGSFTYSQSLELEQGELVFKVATLDWSTVNMGASSQGNIVTFGQRLQLETNSGGDLSLEIPQNGTYLFEFKGPSTINPTITVTPESE